jgi:1-deoxy-D-xylulose-5-phosphate reductoisomerase
VNKGLEVIEAHEIFGVEYEKIKVVVHPQSIVHSMVTFVDGATMAQLSHPDMRLPISIALGVDSRLDVSIGKIAFDEALKLEFEPPDVSVFPGLDLCYEAGRIGQGAPAMLSAANEIAVEAFLSEKIGFYGITDVISDVLQEGIEKVDVEEDVYEADRIARERGRVFVEKRSG